REEGNQAAGFSIPVLARILSARALSTWWTRCGNLPYREMGCRKNAQDMYYFGTLALLEASPKAVIPRVFRLVQALLTTLISFPVQRNSYGAETSIFQVKGHARNDPPFLFL